MRLLAELDRLAPDLTAPEYQAMVTNWLATTARRAMPDPLASPVLPDRFLAAADDPGVDAFIRCSMAEVAAIVGAGIGTPALVVPTDPPAGLLGPVMTEPVSGDDALRLWDAAVLFASLRELRELSRPRTGPPAIPGLVLRRWVVIRAGQGPSGRGGRGCRRPDPTACRDRACGQLPAWGSCSVRQR